MVCVYGSSNDALRRDDNRGMGRGGGGCCRVRKGEGPPHSVAFFVRVHGQQTYGHVNLTLHFPRYGDVCIFFS